jgi:transposase
MSTEYYLINCSRCHKKTEHMIWKLNRLRGGKLRCLECGYVKQRYHNFQEIKPNLIEND